MLSLLKYISALATVSLSTAEVDNRKIVSWDEQTAELWTLEEKGINIKES